MLPIIIIGAVIVLCGVVSCSDEVDLNKKLQEYIYEPGLTSGQKLKISLNLDSLVKQMDETRIYTTENIDSVMILLSNKYDVTTTIYNPNNHASKYKRATATSWGFERPLYLGDINACVGAYAPDTASLVSPTSDSIWVYIEHEFNKSIYDTLQADYLYGVINNISEKPDGTPGTLNGQKDIANFDNSVVGITMYHALAKVRIHVCNLAFDDVAKHNGVSYTYYTGTGDVNHVYFGAEKLYTKTYMNVTAGTGQRILRPTPLGAASVVDKLHWGEFNSTTLEAPQNVCDQLTSTRGDTALYTALVCPGTYNSPTVGVVLDGVGRYVKVKDGNVRLQSGKEYDIYITVCNSTASKLVILNVYVVEWMDSRLPLQMGMSNIVDYFTDLIPINWSAEHKVVWGDVRINEYGDTLKHYEYSSRQPFMYDDNGKLIYAYSDCISPGHVHTGNARLQWAYPSDIYTFSDGRVIQRIASEDKVYIYKNSSATRPSCVLYNTILYDGATVVYNYLSTTKSFTWSYPTDIYTSPDGSKFIHRYDAAIDSNFVFIYDKSGLYYEMKYK